MKKKIYFENLNGFRFLCFLSVFFYHSFHTESPTIKGNQWYTFIKYDLFGNGNLGVNFFFVLSGFLITYLLIEEKKINKNVDLRKFWMRRVLRIWPLFYLCVFLGFAIFPLIKTAFGQNPDEIASLVSYLTFTNNFDYINNGPPDASLLAVLWSVAVEEQFYLIWPVIVFMTPLRKLWVPFLVILVANLFFRAVFDDVMLHEYHTISCIGDMTIGAIGAWLILSFEKFELHIKNLNRWLIYLLYILFTLVFLFRDEVLFSNYYIRIVERMFISILILYMILEQTFSDNSFYKMSYWKTISELGLITYGLYCLHFVGILITTQFLKKFQLDAELWQVMFLQTLISLLLTVIISLLSYRFLEKPFLKLKDKFAYITQH